MVLYARKAIHDMLTKERNLTVTGRNRGQVFRATLLFCRELLEGRKFEPGLGHPTTGKRSVNPAVNGYLLRIREG